MYVCISVSILVQYVLPWLKLHSMLKTMDQQPTSICAVCQNMYLPELHRKGKPRRTCCNNCKYERTHTSTCSVFYYQPALLADSAKHPAKRGIQETSMADCRPLPKKMPKIRNADTNRIKASEVGSSFMPPSGLTRNSSPVQHSCCNR